MPNIKELHSLYALRKPRIQARLEEFSILINESDLRIFEELCFCILTANSSAKSGIKAIIHIGPLLLNGAKEQISNALIQANYRFPNKRAEYILDARQFIKTNLNFQIKQKIASFTDKESLRDYFAENIKGLGYKESSHFLRNIGLKGYCILDKHIVNTLLEFNILSNNNAPKNKKQYLEIESKMKDFAHTLNIPIDELDLLLWSRKTGEILK
ncbi:MAG: N-glycosylase/DNA lyase [Nanoarchaeota archaeon]